MKTIVTTLAVSMMLLASAMAVTTVDKVEVRSPAVAVEAEEIRAWVPQDFAGFYIYIDEDIGQERISTTFIDEALDEPNGIVYTTADEKVALNKDKEILPMELVYVRVSTSDQDEIAAEEPPRYYIYEEIAEPRTHEFGGRGAKVIDVETFEGYSKNFACFYYNIDDEIVTKKFTMNVIDDTLEEHDDISLTSAPRDGPDEKTFIYSEWGSYNVINAAGREYFHSYQDDTVLDEMSVDSSISQSRYIVRLDRNDKISLSDKKKLDLADGYTLEIVEYEKNRNMLSVNLKNRSKIVDSETVGPFDDDSDDIAATTYAYTKDLGDDAIDIVVIAVHFADPQTVNGIWQISDQPAST